jgi:cyclic pyranopterin phosphate synthase
LLIRTEEAAELVRHTVASVVPEVIQPQPKMLSIAVTAACNAGCLGCRYGRDFMVGAQLPLSKVIEILDDAALSGIPSVRLYGGEPLLHPDVPEMVRHAVKQGIQPWLNTNGPPSRKADRLAV